MPLCIPVDKYDLPLDGEYGVYSEAFFKPVFLYSWKSLNNLVYTQSYCKSSTDTTDVGLVFLYRLRVSRGVTVVRLCVFYCLLAKIILLRLYY